jgi:RNA polymerase sigma factor (sigma-70 family)
MSNPAMQLGIRRLRERLACPDASDEQLLSAFLSRRDESAFAALVRRHGPMVLHVCRRVLGHHEDAEDAFQATFVVLSRNAASLRKQSSLASWLHGTAYRTALKAKQTAARRRKHEGQTPSRSPADPSGELLWREVRMLLDEEIARLPERNRQVFVLCCLENLSQAEAGQRLGLKERTVSNRLAAAKQCLQRRLKRRGVELTALLAATAVASETALALPATLSAHVVALAREAAPSLLRSKTKFALALLLIVGTLAGAGMWLSRTPRAAEPPADAPKPAVQKPAAAVESFRYTGRVVDVDGKPLAGAKVFVCGLKPGFIEFRERAVSGADGMFDFRVRRDEFGDKGVVPPGRSPPEQFVHVGATADGHGTACVWAGKAEERANLFLRLPAEEIVRGRVVSLEGKGVAGVHVSATISVLRADKDHKPLPYDAPDNQGLYSGNLLPSEHTVAESDKDGRFTLRGLSRGWLYNLYISGPTIVRTEARLVARPQEPRVMDAAGIMTTNRKPQVPFFGSTFTFVAKPCKPIVGVVRDKESGRPLADIPIRTLWRRDDEPRAWTTSDKDGRYQLTGLPGGIHTLRVEPPRNTPYLDTDVRVVADQPGFEPVTCDIQLQRQPAVSGRVLDRASGKPVRGWVEYRPLATNPNLKTHPDLAEPAWGKHPPTTTTDRDGHFTLPVIAGRGVLLIRADTGYPPARLEKADRGKITDVADPELIDCRPHVAWPGDYHAYRLIDVAADKDLRVDVQLVAGIVRPLVIEYPDGKPRDTMVLGLHPVTGEDQGVTYVPGKSVIAGLADEEIRRLFIATHDTKYGATVLVSGKKRGPVTVKLQPTGTITGQVVDKDGKPIEGVWFRHYYDDGPGRPGVFVHGSYAQRLPTAAEAKRKSRTTGFLNFTKVGSRSERTDKEGRFRLTGIVADTPFDLEASLVGPPNDKGQRFTTAVLRIARPTVKPSQTLDLGSLRAVEPAKSSSTNGP